MPSYEFTCQDCGAAFEVRLSMSAYASGEGRVCSRCGSTRVERAYTTVNVLIGGRSPSDGSWSGGGSCGSGGCGSGGFT